MWVVWLVFKVALLMTVLGCAVVGFELLWIIVGSRRREKAK